MSLRDPETGMPFSFLLNFTVQRREVLVVTSWDRSLAFWSTDGHIIEKLEEKKDDIRLDYDPTCVHYFNEYQFLVVGGSNKFAQLYTKFGEESFLRASSSAPSMLFP